VAICEDKISSIEYLSQHETMITNSDKTDKIYKNCETDEI